MRNFIVLIVCIGFFVYYIKNTNYTVTVYLIQVLLALLTYKFIFKPNKRKERDYD